MEKENRNTVPQFLVATKKLDALLIFIDESGFSLSPIRGTTWAEVEDLVFWLIVFQRHYDKKLIIVWDRLSAHLSAQKYLEQRHSGKFVFEYFETVA